MVTQQPISPGKFAGQCRGMKVDKTRQKRNCLDTSGFTMSVVHQMILETKKKNP